MPSPVPIQPGLFSWPAETPQLIGSRCSACREVTFPAQASCPACNGVSTEALPLSRRGTLWTWTVQRFPPPTPPFTGDSEDFEPFGVGYIELPEGLRVESRLSGCDAGDLEIGMTMELCIEPFGTGPQGEELMTFSFRPAAA